ncbi:hypothetical protein ACI2KO_02090 [Pseudomonas piscis]|uniref:hypothetical protein n=1 Tax=Pseudomonas piscis TaxID=2614538 RepID=UPI00384AB499
MSGWLGAISNEYRLQVLCLLIEHGEITVDGRPLQVLGDAEPGQEGQRAPLRFLAPGSVERRASTMRGAALARRCHSTFGASVLPACR